MLGLVAIGAAVATSLLAAAAARLPRLASTLVVAYLALVANAGLVTLVLSPLHAVTRSDLGLAELVLLGAAALCWQLRGRPRLPLASARGAVGELRASPLAVIFLVVVLAILAYELLLGLTVPPDNMDSLSYHLARAAAWEQHGGLYWIPNTPEIEMNEYQPLAEQQLLFLFAATGSSALYAIPQFIAELAILVAVYGASRRLGFTVAASACASFLLATFGIVALEATTAQNDLVSASLVAASMCLLLGESTLELALGGAAAGMGLGVKLTTALALPFLAWLAFTRGARRFAWAVAGGFVGFAALGLYGYVANEVHTGQFLGAGTALLQDRAGPAYPRSVANAFYLAYGLLDLSVLSNREIVVLALVGLVLAAGAGWALRRSRLAQAATAAAAMALPFLAPVLVLAGSGAVAFAARGAGFPIRGPRGILAPLDASLNEVYTRFANEDYSAYGPIGIVAVVAAIVLTVRAVLRRQADGRQLALACALPGFFVLVSAGSVWVPFLIRYFLIPAVLAAPLLARLFRGRSTTAAYLVAASLTVGLTLVHDQSKPLSSAFGRPWQLSEPQALLVNSDGYMASALEAYDGLVPARACVGAVLEPDEPSFLLYGPTFAHRVFFLPLVGVVQSARSDGLSDVVISEGFDPSVADEFGNAGWQVRPLGTYWLLASAPQSGVGVACRS